MKTSKLKEHHGSHVVSAQLPKFNEGDLVIRAMTILDRRVKKKNNKPTPRMQHRKNYEFANPISRF